MFQERPLAFEIQLQVLPYLGVPLVNGSFTVLLGNYGAYAGDWDVNVQIWQNNQIVNQAAQEC
jgi:hypothetical protein